MICFFLAWVSLIIFKPTEQNLFIRAWSTQKRGRWQQHDWVASCNSWLWTRHTRNQPGPLGWHTIALTNEEVSMMNILPLIRNLFGSCRQIRELIYGIEPYFDPTSRRKRQNIKIKCEKYIVSIWPMTFCAYTTLRWMFSQTNNQQSVLN
jgi:hypothetical protein